MRIGIDIRELEKNKRTGIGRFILNFLYFVNSYDKENEYLLFGNQNTRYLNFGGNMQSKIIPEFNKIFWEQVVLPREIEKEKIDIFFSPFYKGPLFSRAKLIVACHDLYFLELEKNPVEKWLKIFYCKIIWNKAKLIIAVSSYSKQKVIKFLGCSEEKIRVVYDSVEEKFKPMGKGVVFPKLIKRFSQIKKDFLLYVGNFKPHKNVSRIIQAYSLLSGPLKDRYQLVIVGQKNKDYYPLAQLVRDHGLEGKVEFLGLVSENELVFLYNSATVLLLVSLREGFGLPALEAMACGTPVIASNLTALPEVIGDAGFLVNPYDVKEVSSAIKVVLGDEALRKQMSEKGLLRAKKFLIRDSANKILEIFKELE